MAMFFMIVCKQTHTLGSNLGCIMLITLREEVLVYIRIRIYITMVKCVNDLDNVSKEETTIQ